MTQIFHWCPIPNDEFWTFFWVVCVQDFADEQDVMPSITMENNVIHNNEGYGVILVKPNNGEQLRVPLDRGEGRQSSHSQTVKLKTWGHG